MPFPSQSPITIDPDRSVSIVGRSADDGGRVTLNGLGASRFFVVDGGTLHLTHLNLVNGSAPVFTYCDTYTQDSFKCAGGAIAVFEDGQLVMTSCDIRGQGQHDVLNAYGGGGVFVLAHRTAATFFNVSFVGLRAAYRGAAVHFANIADDGVANVFMFRHCNFVNNYAVEGVVQLIMYQMFPYFYDCVFEFNECLSLGMSVFTGCYGEIARCVFRGNKVMTASLVQYSDAAISVGNGADYVIWDCLFEGNVGPAGGKGGALSFSSGRATVINSTFIGNITDEAGAIHLYAAASMTLIGCYARENSAFGSYGGTFSVSASTFLMRNSTVAESYALDTAVGMLYDGAIGIIKNSVFTDSRAT